MTIRNLMTLVRVTAVLLAGLCVACGAARADELVLKNGDKLSGKVMGIDSGKVVFKADLFGDVKVPADSVVSVTTTAPVTVEFTEGGYATGRLQPSDPGTVRLQGANEVSSRFQLAKVKALHPDGKVPVPQFKWTGHVNAGFSKATGNTETEAYHVDAETIGRGEKDRITLGAEVHTEKTDDRRTADNQKLAAQYDRFLSKAWYVYVSGSAERDDFENLKLRTTIGVGGGYQIIDTARTQLSIEAGPSYVNEDFETAPDEDFASARWALKYSMWVFDKFAQLFHNHEGLVSLEDTEDTLIRTKTGFRIPVRSNINVTAQVNWDYDNTPPAGADKNDAKYILSVGYNW